jgi:tetrahydromethanopterin S-methyltransferase subunit G
MVIPKAKTASDKLKMKGESLTVDNITEQMSTGDETGKKKIKIAEKVEDTTQEFGHIIIKIIGLLLALITGIMLVVLILSVAGLSSFSGMNLMLGSVPVFESLNLSFGILSVLLLILAGIPIALLFLLGIKMLFPNTKSLNKNLLIISGVVWLIALAYITSKTSALMMHKNEDAKITTAQIAWSAPADTLNLYNLALNFDEQDEAVTDNRIYYKYHPSSDDKFHLKIEYFAEGKTQKTARDNARKIQFLYAVDSLQNKITFDESMTYPEDNFIIDRKTYVHVYIPQGKYLKITENYRGFGDFSSCEPPFVLKNENSRIICDKSGQNNGKTREEVIRINGGKVHLKIDEKGVNIQAAGDSAHAAHIKIDEHGISIKAKEKNEEVGIEINEKGVKIKKKKDE